MKPKNNGCNKVCYPDALTAKHILDKIQTRYKPIDTKRQESREYYCYKCESWHLTSISQSQNAIRAKKREKYFENRRKWEADYWTKKLGVHEDDY